MKFTGLAEYFLYDIFDAHPRAYQKNMNLADFVKTLDDFRQRMNDQNDCAFVTPSEASILQIYEAYEKGMVTRSRT